MSSDLLFKKKEGMSDLQQYPKNLLMENVGRHRRGTTFETEKNHILFISRTCYSLIGESLEITSTVPLITCTRFCREEPVLQNLLKHPGIRTQPSKSS